MYQEKLSKSKLDFYLELETSELTFIFENILYKQIDKITLGFPLGFTIKVLIQTITHITCVNFRDFLT